MTTSRSIAVLAIVGAVSFVHPPLGAQATPAAPARLSADRVISRALALMGGEQTLRNVERVAYRMMTQWQRTNFRSVPYVDQPSYEQHTDARDYTIPAWRNTREFGTNRIINVIRDSIALTTMGTAVQPLSIAYVDERAELFVYTPDRLVLALRDAADLALGADTMIGGERHTRVTGTLASRFRSTVFFHSGTGLPTMLRFRAGHPNDFGLVAWGVMPVEVWYSAWRTFGAISTPAQWDILRVGVPYKRMTVQSANFNAAFAADSFAVTPEQRAMYLASSATRPMHENVVRRAVSMPTPDIAMINAFGIQAGAARIDRGWIMLGAGHTTFSYAYGERLLDSLGATPITAVLAATSITATNGGVLTAVDRGIPVYVSQASEASMRRMFEGAARPVRGLTRVKAGTTIGSGAYRMQLEPLDLPNAPGSLMAYSAHNGWLYLPDAVTPLDIAVARERARALGWAVKAVGTAGVLFQPVAP